MAGVLVMQIDEQAPGVGQLARVEGELRRLVERGARIGVLGHGRRC